ncbi:MAG: DegT/DnrJ/EryC1/StrS family aminotransferase [Chloroflexota bacterium]|nr:DegT/DnrJ/EryC1/StrS family aminotransferase [Chloroflexota bacterium]
MTMRRLPITRPYIGEEELEAVQIPLRSGWLVQGPMVAEFEGKFEAFTGIGHALATSSCTTALHLAVAALGLKPGDEVIVPGFTWVATANVVEYMGARPIFCDIDLETFNIDVSQIESKITPRTVGIIPVHLFGLAAEMDAIKAIADEHGLWLIEDAACAFGALYHDRHVGSIGDLGCFSFHPRKSITTGEGGMVTTESDDLARTISSLRDHGASKSDFDRHRGSGSYQLADYDMLGYNYRLTDLQAAVGSVQMDRAGWILGERIRCAEAYDRLLGDVGWLRTPHTPDGLRHAYQAYVCLFQPESPTLDNVDRLHDRRNRLMMDLEDQGIATRPGTHAAFAQGFYASKYGLSPADFPSSYLAERLSLAVPLFPQLAADDLEYVAANVIRLGREL